jgi:hypothetical protein
MNIKVQRAFKTIEDELVDYLKKNGQTPSPELSKATDLNGPCDPVSGQPGWAFGFFCTRLLEQGRIKIIQEKRGARKFFEAV